MAAAEMTPAELRALFDRVLRAESLINGFLEPLGKASRELFAFRQEFAEALAGLVEGTCDNCSAVILKGEPGYRYEDGETFCAACAPTYGDVRQEWVEYVTAAEEAEDKAEGEAAIAAIDAYVAGGGSPGDKMCSFGAPAVTS